MTGVGIIGTGWWAREHARALRALPELRLVACAGRRADHAAAFARELDIDGYDDYRRVLERRDVGTVAVVVPHDQHAAVAIDALRAGKHVLLEKPMARDRAECAAIAGAAGAAEGVFMLGLTHHFIPELAAAKARLQRGELGAVVSGLCLFTHSWEWQRRPAFYRDRALGGGVWMTQGVHFVDRLLWLIDSDVISVTGMLSRRFHTAEEQQADDAATAMLRFASGASGTLTVAGYRAGPPCNETRIIAEGGALRLDARGLAVSHGNGWLAVATPAADPLVEEWRAFARAIEERTPPPVSLPHALRVMETTFAVEESSASGREYRMSDAGLEIGAVDPRIPEAAELIRALSDELARRYDYVDDGSGQFKPEDALIARSAFVVGRAKGRAVACGAFRPLEGDVAEIKRMFVVPACRGRGYARAILTELERLARESGYTIARLETADRQPEAIGLYERAGYRRIPNFGVYVGSERSVCFEKHLVDARHRA